MRVRLNLAVSLATSLLTAALALITVPVYLRYLGPESYGVIGFFVSYQTALSLLDLGLSPAISRDVARLGALGDWSLVNDLIRTTEALYWAMGVLVGVGTMALAPMLGEHWLVARTLPTHDIVTAGLIMGGATALRWPVSLYNGVLQGLHRTGEANLISAAFAVGGAVAAVLVVTRWTASLPMFFAVQALVTAVQVVSTALLARHRLPRSGRAAIRPALVGRLWRFSAGMSALSITGIVFTQLDKVVLGRIVDLASLGRYVLAGTLVGTLYRLTLPVYQVAAPRLSALLARDDRDGALALYHWGTFTLMSLLAPAGLGLVLGAEPLVALWTGDAELARQARPLIALLALGSVLDGAMTLPAAMQVALGSTRIPIIANLWSILLQVPLTLVLTWWLGLLGGALAWLALHVVHFIIGMGLTHRRLLPGAGPSWLLRDFGRPVACTIAVGAVTAAVLARQDAGPLLALGIVVCASATAVALSLASGPYRITDARKALA